MKKLIRYAISAAVLLFLGYNSVYFRKLDAVKKEATGFDAVAYARNHFRNQLAPALRNAIEINQLIALLQTDKNKAFDTYSHALGIGNIRFFLVRGEGRIDSIGENDASVLCGADSSARRVRIATEFVFGNAIRDASGLIDINSFTNTMDFNAVSAELNKIVRTEVLPPFRARARPGQRLRFTGAVELNREHLDLKEPEVIPVQLELLGN